MRGGGAEGDGGDAEPDEEAAIARAPAHGDLLADRVDARQRGAGERARPDLQHAADRGRDESEGGGGGDQGAGGEDPPRVVPVGGPVRRERDGAEDEAELHRGGQRRRAARRQRRLGRHPGQDSGGDEPQAHTSAS
jgi:hypothetical protein